MDRIGPKSTGRLYILEWMERKGVDRKTLAGRLDTSEATVSRLINNRRKMTLEWMYHIAHALGIPVDELHRDPSRPSPEDILRRVPPEKQKQLLDYAEFLSRTGTDG